MAPGAPLERGRKSRSGEPAGLHLAARRRDSVNQPGEIAQMNCSVAGTRLRSWMLRVLTVVAVAAAACAPAAAGVDAAWPTRADQVAAHPAFTPEGIAALDARMKEG